MNDLVMLLAVLAGWVFLQAWLLPKLGVPDARVPQVRVTREQIVLRAQHRGAGTKADRAQGGRA